MVSIRRLQSVESEDESAWESLDLTTDTISNTYAREPSRQDQQQQQQQQEQTQTYNESDPSAPPALEDETPSPAISSPSFMEITSPKPSNSQNNGTSSNSRRASAEPMLDASSSSVLLKESLVHHPMNLFWSRFLLHFTQELWKLDVHICLALALITLGAVVKTLLCLTWFVWNPRTCLTILLGLGPFLYFQRHAIQRRLQQIAAAVDSSSTCSPEVLLEAALGRLEPVQLRRFMFFILFVPTLLEARTIVFLSSIKVDQAGSWSTIYNVTIATALAVGAYCYGGFFLQQHPHQHSPRFLAPRECLQRALLFLYASALCVSLICLDLWRLPHLIAPFCLASGVLILAWHDDDGDNVVGTSGKTGWFSNCVRQALRLTVRDILTTITDSVCQDQMLQLAMLRWVVEYWSTSTSTTPTSPGAPRSGTTRNPATPPPSSSTAHSTNSTHNDEGLRNTATAEHHHQLQWDELWPMLNTTTDQMAVEIRSLHRVGSNTTSSATSNANNNHYGARNNSTTPDPVRDLQSLLASLDLDERAKPAVMAYKRGVQDFPPERNWSIAFALIHRCPAILALVWQVFYYWTLEWRRTLLLLRPWGVTCSAMLILLPLVALELLRIHTWICSCQAAAAAPAAASSNDTKEDIDYAACLQVLDSMTILLSGDDYNPRRPPALLRVWRNVTDSVEALEVGIVTTRCLQTTAVAVEFADNVRSLLQFGAEVQEYGWVHGIAVALKEVILYHQQQNHNADAVASRTTTSVTIVQPRAKYANAAVGAFRNSQRLSRNLKILTQDEDVTKLGAPLVSALSVITGYGWLWGRSDDGQRIEEADSSKKTRETARNDIAVAKKCDTTAYTSLELRSESTDSEPQEAWPLVQPVKETEIAADLLTTTGVALTTTAFVAAAMAKKYNIRSPNDNTTQTDNHDISSQIPAKDDEIAFPSLSSSSSIRAEPTSLPENIDDSPTVLPNSPQEKKDSAVSVATSNCITAAVAASAAEIDGFHRTNDDESKAGNNVSSNFNPTREDSTFSSPTLSTKTSDASERHEKSQANEGVTADLNANKEKADEGSLTMSPNSVEDVKEPTSSVGPTNSLHGGAASDDAANNYSSIQADDIGDKTAKVLALLAVCDENDTRDKNVICEKLVVDNPSNDLLDGAGCPPQGLLEINNASTRALVVNDRSPQQENPLLDFTGSLRQILIVDQGGNVPSHAPPEDSDDEWEGLEPDPFESDTPLTENSMIKDQPSKPEKDKHDGDQGGSNLFLGLAAVGAAAIGVAAVAFAGQNKNNNDKDDNRQTQRSRSNPTS